MNKKILIKEIQIFTSYIYKARWCNIFSGVIFISIYGSCFFNLNLWVDMEAMINNPYSDYNFLDIGRYGLILTKYIFGLRWFNPFIATGMGYLLLWFSGVLFGYIFWRCSHDSYAISSIFGIICFVSPIMVEQFYFQFQIFEIAWAYCLCALSIGLSYYGILKNSMSFKFISILCMIWSFSSYQAFVVIYISGIVGCFITIYHYKIKKHSIDNFPVLKILIWHISLFIIAFLLNEIIANVFFVSSDYLDNQILWGKVEFRECINNILYHISNAFLGDGVFFTSFYLLFSVLIILFLIIDIIKNKNCKFRFIYVASGIGLQLCPFLLTIYMGNIPVIRGQLFYPFVIAWNVIILLNGFFCLGWKKVLGVIMTLTLFFTQANLTLRLIYTDTIRSKEDLRLLLSVEEKLENESLNNKPIVFLGRYNNNLNASCVRGQTIGVSIFSFDVSTLPHYYWSTYRVCNIAQTQGLNFESAAQEQVLEARNEALKAPCWPQEGSVIDAGDYVIIKLSEDQWPEEILDSKIYETTAPSIDETLKYSVDSVQIANGTLSIRGWMIQEGVLSDSLLPTVYLQEKNTQNCYQLSTAKVYRPDLEEAFENGQLYTNGGFVSVASVDMLEAPIEDYELILALENSETGEKHAVSTNYQWPAELVK